MSGTAAAPEGITNPPIDELLDADRLQVQPGDLRRQARPPDQRLLLPARRGPARVRRPARRDPRPGEAALDRAARDQRRPARPPSTIEPRPDAAREPSRPRHARRRPRGRPRRRRRASPPTRPCELLRGCSPRPGTTSASCPPAAALEFVGARHLGGAVRPAGAPPRSGTTSHEVPHVRLGQEADLVVVAPATADLLAQAAHGLADDLLTNTLLTARCPVRDGARRCTPRCGSTRPPRPTSPRCARAASSSSTRPSAG